MKKQIVSLYITVLLTALISLSSCWSQVPVFVSESKSFFSDFEVRNEKVAIRCEITLQNTFGSEYKVKLKAHFPDDVGKLLRQETLIAMDDNGDEAVFIIPAYSEKTFEVLFVGDFAGTNEKHDRRLPELEVILVSE